MEANKKKRKNKGGSKKGYRVLLLTHESGRTYTASRVGRLAKGLSTKEVLEILKGLAPRKRTTAVAVTKTGTIHLAARAGKAGGKNRTSARVARLAAKTRSTGTVMEKRKMSKRKAKRGKKSARRRRTSRS